MRTAVWKLYHNEKKFISNPAGSINEALLFCHIKSIIGTQLSYQDRKLSPYLSIPPSVILQQEGADNAISYDAEPIINAVSFGRWQHTLECMISLIPLVFYALLLTPACWKSSNRKRTFSCFGPHIRNWFPQDLRHCSTLSSFKAKLKTFLFSQYFHPS